MPELPRSKHARGRLRAIGRRRKLRRRIASVPYWHHSLDLGDGVVTPGVKDRTYHAVELEQLRLPDLSGKSVLDIGTWDGFYAFEAERRGAAHVVALDFDIWQRDLRELIPEERRAAYPAPCPGKRGFEIAHEVLGSNVEAVTMDVHELAPERLGTFDVVLFLGVIYHLRNPFDGITRAVSVTDELLVIESHLNWFPDHEDRAMFAFYECGELLDDPTNWWGPNARGLRALTRAAGCVSAELVGMIAPPDPEVRAEQHYRGMVHGHKGLTGPAALDG